MKTLTQPSQPQVTSGIGHHLSHSQTNTFTRCSLKWWFSRHFEAEFSPSALPFGRAFHEGIACFYRRRLEGETASLQNMLAAYQKAFASEELPILYGKNESAESLHATAERMFKAFLSHVPDSTVLAVEQPFSISVSPNVPRITGFIDLVEIRQGSKGPTLCIVDFKTASKQPNPDDIQPDQLMLYKMAAKASGMAMEFDLPVLLFFRYITKVKNPEVIEIPVETGHGDETRLVAKLEAVYRGMKAGAIFPNPSWACSTCPFQSHCSFWPDLGAIEARFQMKKGKGRLSVEEEAGD